MMLISLTGALVQDLICPIPPETGCGLEGPTYKEIIIEDGGWRCYPYFHDVCTEGYTMTLMVDATRRYLRKAIIKYSKLHAPIKVE